jgi:hypothetical protein
MFQLVSRPWGAAIDATHHVGVLDVGLCVTELSSAREGADGGGGHEGSRKRPGGHYSSGQHLGGLVSCGCRGGDNDDLIGRLLG